MKKTIVPLLFASVLLAVGCNSSESGNSNSTASGDSGAAPSADQDAVTAAPAPEDKETSAIAELCPCVNTALANMSPRVKRIVMDAGKHPNPSRVLATELRKNSSVDEQSQLRNELEQFQYDPALLACSENLKSKFNLDEANPRTREKLMRAAEKNKECELVYALLRIADAQEKEATAPQQ